MDGIISIIMVLRKRSKMIKSEQLSLQFYYFKLIKDDYVATQ